jgi:D-2-hydroxyacid dehydrogenase (NADP+)
MLPPKDRLTIGFAHAACRMKETLDGLETGITNFEVRDHAGLDRRIAEADVIVISGLWHSSLIGSAPRPRCIQSISAGTDQCDKARLWRGETTLRNQVL